MKTAEKFKMLRGKMKMSQVELAKFLEMSPGSVYKYEKGQHVPRVDILEKMEAFVDSKTKLSLKGEFKLENTPLKIVKESEKDSEINANYVLGLQKDKIEQLQAENLQLKNAINLTQSKLWTEVEYHFYSKVEITFIPFQRRVQKMTGDGLAVLSEKLEIPMDTLLDKYFSVNKWHPYNNHPCDKIICEKNLDDLKKMTREMPSIYNYMKLLVGEHYSRQIIIYEHNGLRVPSLCHIKVRWLEHPHVAECKTQFIIE